MNNDISIQTEARAQKIQRDIRDWLLRRDRRLQQESMSYIGAEKRNPEKKNERRIPLKNKFIANSNVSTLKPTNPATMAKSHQIKLDMARDPAYVFDWFGSLPGITEKEVKEVVQAIMNNDTAELGQILREVFINKHLWPMAIGFAVEDSMNMQSDRAIYDSLKVANLPGLLMPQAE